MSGKTEIGNLLGRGMSFPPKLGPDGRLRWSEGVENIQESIRVILMTELQERLMLPTFGAGLQIYLFEPNNVTTHRLIEERVRRALEHSEPRIDVKEVSVDPDPGNAEAAILKIDFDLIATGSKGQTSLSVQLSG